MTIKIPKKLGHIWVGPLTPPHAWLDTWKEKHTDWDYVLYDNDFLNSFQFKTKHLIDFYLDLEQYAGVADLMRYEILYEYGGFIPEADSICYHNTDELFSKPCAYTVYENEFTKGNLVSPILASEPKNPFLKQVIDELLKLTIKDLDTPWMTTGNLFIAKMIEKYNPKITIFPSHYFIPIHFNGSVYDGSDKIYCKQLFGTTQSFYSQEKITNKKMNLLQKIRDRSARVRKRALAKRVELAFAHHRHKRLSNFDKNYEE